MSTEESEKRLKSFQSTIKCEKIKKSSKKLHRSIIITEIEDPGFDFVKCKTQSESETSNQKRENGDALEEKEKQNRMSNLQINYGSPLAIRTHSPLIKDKAFKCDSFRADYSFGES